MATKEIQVMTYVREKSVVVKNDQDPTDTSNDSKKMRSTLGSSEETDTNTGDHHQQPRKYSSNYMMDHILFSEEAPADPHIIQVDTNTNVVNGGSLLNSTFKPTPKMCKMSQSSMNICKVCGDKASGFHYKVLSCDGCRGFFKRMVRGKNLAGCKYKDNCIITKELRNNCKSCRFKKCLLVGMDRSGVHSRRRKSRLDENNNTNEQPLTTSCTDNSNNNYSSEAYNSVFNCADNIARAEVQPQSQLLVGRQNGELKKYGHKRNNNLNNVNMHNGKIPEHMPAMLTSHFSKLMNVVNQQQPSTLLKAEALGVQMIRHFSPPSNVNFNHQPMHMNPPHIQHPQHGQMTTQHVQHPETSAKTTVLSEEEKKRIITKVVSNIINEIATYANFNYKVLKANAEQVVIMVERNWPGLFVLGLADHMRNDRNTNQNCTQILKEALKEALEHDLQISNSTDRLEEYFSEIDSIFSMANDLSLAQLTHKEYHFLRAVVLFHQKRLLCPKEVRTSNTEESTYEQRHYSLQSFHFKYNFYTFVEMLMKRHYALGDVVTREISTLMNFLITFRNINVQVIESQLHKIIHRDGPRRLDKAYWARSISA